MIPKIIHYCWLSSDPIPVQLEEYMKSWKVHLPDYDFMLWNFERFNITESQWVKEAFEHKRFAFAADYIRLYAVYNYGGIYLDMDVELLKSFDRFLHLSTMICYEKHQYLPEMAAFGAERHSLWVKECLSYYEERKFINNGVLDTKILPLVIKEALASDFKIVPVSSLEEASRPIVDPYEVRVLPSEYFSPKNYWTGKIALVENTVCIHHFLGSWLPPYLKTEARICEYLGIKNFKIIERVSWKLRALKLLLLKQLNQGG
jgi:hypothetical protein